MRFKFKTYLLQVNSEVVGFLFFNYKENSNMEKISPKFELVAFVFVTSVAVLLEIVIIQKYFLDPKTASNQQQYSNQLQIQSGAQIKIPGVDLSSYPKTLIIALQKGCHFCTSSAPFYKSLIENVQDKNIKLVAVLPDSPEEARDYLDKMGLTSLEIKQFSFSNLRVRGTPTLILINAKGEVTNSWVGKLNSIKEEEVIKSL